MPKHNDILHPLAVEEIPQMVRMMVQQAVFAHVVAVDHVALVNVSVHVDGLEVADGQGPVEVWAFCYSPVSGGVGWLGDDVKVGGIGD